ncbi:exo-beta-D-glucosaminidase [Metarhizium album ARSEF 1941]|uniref:Exo-beta-D-glucosaminidase n=1 Tax=Metarhizium album (strain ARSEF 1941) TaxID=1081103 RepID=A0A0B2WZW6_METAS|nr:exo-beta-D-glucosaminidase [Metarhizium album ARSEF 1941]KHN98375.1 exo-beta-D-glucosaminidase [Metarhizium album ARSEF 1941]
MTMCKVTAVRGAVALVLATAGVSASATSPLTSKAGQVGVIPSWHFQSSSSAGKDLASLSQPGVDTSSWYHANQSRCTTMGCMIAAGMYQDDSLWFSDNLSTVDWGQFRDPWVYRNEFSLSLNNGQQHYFLQTNGITARADIFLNGNQVADREQQAGSFGGHSYDITSLVGGRNALAVNVYPSDHNHDLIYTFVDWSPRAPDNGTGIWRDMTVKQTGPVALGPVSVSVDIEIPVKSSPARVSVRAKVQNLKDHPVQVDATSVLSEASGCIAASQTTSLTLEPKQTKLVEVPHHVETPKIWWPRSWGGQPLYKARLTLRVANETSDVAEETFGIRTVTAALNSHNDTMFTVNGYPFRVLGAGYSPDMFFRWHDKRWADIMRYSHDMGLNTIRLEGMMEHPELYRMADEAGMMILAGFVCCSKWEAWSHNADISPNIPWTDNDYETAKSAMRHEAAMMQTHPCLLGFLLGSDSWPDDRATDMYVDTLKDSYWQTPIIASASKRGFPALLGPSGMKMSGPYDWVPPNYWYDTEPSEDRLGAAFGFGSELGAGVGTPAISSLKKFMTQEEMEDLWMKPDAKFVHMSTNTSAFRRRTIYNEALARRYGKPTSLRDYMFKTELMDYESTRPQFEAYSARQSQDRPATGTIYWMLNNAWPSLHWNLFDHYLHPAGSYFGTKVGSRLEHVAYDYVREEAWIINHSLDRKGRRTIAIDLIGLDGESVSKDSVTVDTTPNKSGKAAKISGSDNITDVAFLRLILSDHNGQALSRNVYWLAKSKDALNWSNSTWYHTPVTEFSDYGALSKMKTAKLSVTASKNGSAHSLVLENKSRVPAFFIRLNLVDEAGEDVNPVFWSDNYITLWPWEKLALMVNADGRGTQVLVNGGNVEASQVML